MPSPSCPKVKVCGLREPGNIREVVEAGVDYIGLIFHPGSPRFVGDLDPAELYELKVKKVGVFVDASIDEVLDLAARYRLDLLQLHGSESTEDCAQLQAFGYGVIKVFGVDEQFDFETVKPYHACADFFLFDTKTPKHGGSGQTFDWSVLDKYDQQTPFLLSGGLGPEQVEQLPLDRGWNLHAVDLNSRLEMAPGHKDPALLATFLTQLHVRCQK